MSARLALASHKGKTVEFDDILGWSMPPCDCDMCTWNEDEDDSRDEVLSWDRYEPVL